MADVTAHQGTERAKLTAKIDATRRSITAVSWIVWTVAAVIAIYAIPIVYNLLVDHDVPPELAWLLSPAVDGALAVGIIATSVLARLNQPYGWVGAIRWVSGLTGWGLNTAGPWTHPGGVDWLGVLTHTAGPLILFVVVEGAAQFQHRAGKALAAMEEQLASLDLQGDRDRAERQEMTDRLRRLEADLRAAEAREKQYAADAAAVKEEAAAEVERIRVEADAEVGILRQRATTAEAKTAQLAEELEAASNTHRAALAKVRAEAAEKIALARAEATVPRLSDRRTGSTGGGSKNKTAAPSGSGRRPAVPEEIAVQKCIAEHPEPNYPWTQQEIVNIVGCGWGRAPRLLDAISEFHSNAASTAPTAATSAASEAASG